MLTLLITTFNRPAHLARLLRHLEIQHTDLPIQICDASSQPALSRNTSAIESAKRGGLPCQHLILDSKVDYFEALFRGLEKTTTPYVVWIADDDFVVPQNVSIFAKFLSENASYAAAIGRFIYFSTQNNQAHGALSHASVESMVRYSWEEETATKRIVQNRLEPYVRDSKLTSYAVMPTELALRIYRETLSLGLNLKETEILTAHHVLLNGKIRVFDTLQGARQMHTHNTGLIATQRSAPVLTHAADAAGLRPYANSVPNIFPESIKRMIISAARELDTHDALGPEKAVALVSAWYWSLWGSELAKPDEYASVAAPDRQSSVAVTTKLTKSRTAQLFKVALAQPKLALERRRYPDYYRDFQTIRTVLEASPS